MWLFQPLLPGAAQQNSGPQTISADVTESATASDTKSGSVPHSATITEGYTGLANIGYIMGGAETGAGNVIHRVNLQSEVLVTLGQVLPYPIRNAASLASNDKGYAAGGLDNNGDGLSSIQYMVFSSETLATLGNSLPGVRSFAHHASSSTKGYACGGQDGVGWSTAIDALTFSTETATTIAAVVAIEFSIGGSVQSAGRGFFGGNASLTTTIHGIRFDTEATLTTGATLATARYNNTGCYSSSRGYFCGGNDDSDSVSEIDGIRFDTEASINPSASLATARENACALSSSTDGFVAAGVGSQYLSSVERLNFAAETVSATSMSVGNRPQSSFATQCARSVAFDTLGTITPVSSSESVTSDTTQNATGPNDASFWAGPNTTNRGYYLGGFTGSSGTTVTTGLEFSSESSTTTGGTLLAASYMLSGAEGTYNGIFGGGYVSGSREDNLYRLEFASQSVVALTSVLNEARAEAGSVASSSKAYFAGGENSSFVFVDAITTVDFTSFAAQTIASVLQTARARMSTGYSSTKGYFASGYETGGSDYLTGVSSIQYSNNSVSTATATVGAYARGCGSQNASNAYMFGGVSWGGTRQNAIYGLRFSDETNITITSTLPVGRERAGSSESSTKAYIAGGVTTATVSSVVSYTFSDTTVSAISATLETAKYDVCGLSYNGGGTDGTLGARAVDYKSLQTPVDVAESVRPPRGIICGGNAPSDTTETYWFLTETAVANSATLTEAIGNAATVQSSNLGYLVGGYGSDFVTAIRTYGLATDIVATAGGSLSVAKAQMAGVSSSSSGYFAGGIDTSTVLTAIQKIAFSNDAVSTLSATLPSARFAAGGVASSTKGYFAGGGLSTLNNTASAAIEALTFADDTLSTLGGALSVAKKSQVGVASSTNGYIANGLDAAGTTTISIDRILFSSDAVSTSTAATQYRWREVGTASSTSGYIASGCNPTTALTSGYGILFSTHATTTKSSMVVTARNNAMGFSCPTNLSASDVLSASNASSGMDATITESATSSDAENATASWAVSGAGSASTSASDSGSSTLQTSASMVEPASGADSVSAIATMLGYTAESATSGAAATSSLTQPGGASEPANAITVQQVFTNLDGPISESATSSDASLAGVSTSGSVSESGSATASETGDRMVAAAILEGISVSDVASSLLFFNAEVAEGASSGESVSGSLLYLGDTTESATPTSASDAIFVSVVVESATPVSTQSVNMNYAVAGSAVTSASSSQRVAWMIYSVEVIGQAEATETSSGKILTHGVIAEQEYASEAQTTTMLAVVNCSALGIAQDAKSGGVAFSAQVHELTSAITRALGEILGERFVRIVRAYVGSENVVAHSGEHESKVRTGSVSLEVRLQSATLRIYTQGNDAGNAVATGAATSKESVK